MLTKFLRIFLKLNLTFHLLSVLGGVIYLACFLILDDDEMVLYF
jgi:lipid-A-disaccharide synthase-like uncharacterized protein